MTMMRRRLMQVGGVSLPSNVEAYIINFDEDDSDGITIQHTLGVAPSGVTVVNLTNEQMNATMLTGAIWKRDSDRKTMQNTVAGLDSSASSGYRGTSFEAADIVFSETSVTIPTSTSSTSITKYRAGTTYLVILTAHISN